MCDNPEPYHPHNADGTCHYWKRTDAVGVTHDEPQCTYWLNEAWRANCEATGKMRAELDAMTPEQRAEADGRLF